MNFCKRTGGPEYIYHVAERGQLEAARTSGRYAAESLAGEGFIHCSAHHQIATVLDTFYPEREGFVILTINPTRLEARLVWEKPRVPPGTQARSWELQAFPHLYGPLNLSAVVDEIDIGLFRPGPRLAGGRGEPHPEVPALIRQFGLKPLPVEGTLYAATWEAPAAGGAGSGPAGTAMIGLYAESPESRSCFHRLAYDEVWHFYSGDPLRLVLLHPDGRSEDVVMGPEPLRGQKVQFVVPAGVWQAGQLIHGGRYALFGCTMAPGFTGACFEAASAAELEAGWPDRVGDIRRLSVAEGGELRMPASFR